MQAGTLGTRVRYWASNWQSINTLGLLIRPFPLGMNAWLSAPVQTQSSIERKGGHPINRQWLTTVCPSERPLQLSSVVCIRRLYTIYCKFVICLPVQSLNWVFFIREQMLNAKLQPSNSTAIMRLNSAFYVYTLSDTLRDPSWYCTPFHSLTVRSSVKAIRSVDAQNSPCLLPNWFASAS